MSEDLAYAAGLIDGEGCIGTYYNKVHKNYQLRVSVEMCEREGLDHLANLFGGKWYYKQKRAPRRGIYCWMVFNSEAERCLKALYPHLKVKKKHAEAALLGDWHSYNRSNPLTEAEKIIRKEINIKIKSYNERGYYEIK